MHNTRNTLLSGCFSASLIRVILFAFCSLFLGWAGQASAATYYVDNATGNDANSEVQAQDNLTPWKTIGKAWGSLKDNSGTNTVHIATGNYYSEVYVSGGAMAGATLEFIADGAVVVRIASTNPQAYTLRADYTGTNIFRGYSATTKIEFDQTVYGDGSDNAGNKYFFYTGAAASFEFFDVYAHGKTRFGVSAVAPASVSFTRSKFTDFSTYLGFYNSTNFTMVASYVSSALITLTVNATVTNLILRNNTFVNSRIINSGTGGTTNTTIENNILSGTTAILGQRPLALTVVSGTVSVNNNLLWITNLPSPRTGATYPILSLTGTATEWYQPATTFFGNPNIDTAPALLSTSIAIGRGKDAGITTDINGTSFDNTNLPMIGAWAPASGSKQVITPTAKKIAMVGDSWTYGTGATTAAHRYTDQVAANLPDYTFVMMPGDTTTQLGISGITSKTTHMMAQEFAVSETPSAVTLLVGINDGATLAAATIAAQINATISALLDLGIPNVVYIGTQPDNGLIPTTTIADAVEAAVLAEYGSNSQVAVIRLTQKFKKVTSWNSTLYTADANHVNNAGHDLLSELVVPAITSEYYISTDSATLSYQKYNDASSYKYGLTIAGDNATINNLSVSGFANDGILIQANSPTIKNTISYNNTGYEVNQTLAGASLTAPTESHNNFNGSVNGFTWNGAGKVDANPLFVSSSDLHLQFTSPAIDAGTDVGLTTDYAGNPSYGTPDISAYEYQPPHALTAATPDTVDTGAGARIYANGKFRDLGTTNNAPANLKITPQGGSFSTYDATTTRPAWLDITAITNWTTTHKTWTESNAQSASMVTDHTVGDLNSNTYYTITVTDAAASDITGINGTVCDTGSGSAICQSNSNGSLSFQYSGAYSTHTFDLTEGDNPAPASSSSVSNGPVSSGGILLRLRSLTRGVTREEAGGQIVFQVTPNVPLTLSAKPVDSDQMHSLTLRVNNVSYPMHDPDQDLTYTTKHPGFTQPGRYPYTLTANYGTTTFTEKGTFVVFDLTQSFPLSQLNQLFRSVFGRTPTFAEWTYWAKRREDKPQPAAFLGALQYSRLQQGSSW